MQATRSFLTRLGLPSGDAYDLPTSSKRFSDGAQYRFEVPGIQGPGAMKALLEALDTYNITIHRVTQTKGIMMLADEDIRDMVALAVQWQVDLVLAIGPRATYDTSASVQTKEGQRMGLRLRGQEQASPRTPDVAPEEGAVDPGGGVLEGPGPEQGVEPFPPGVVRVRVAAHVVVEGGQAGATPAEAVGRLEVQEERLVI